MAVFQQPSSKQTNEAPSICRTCGGQCCLTRPGVESPERFLASADPVVCLFEALATGHWVLDRHYGLPAGEDGAPPIPAAELELLYPRPATVSEHSNTLMYGSAETGPCVFLTDAGCSLSFEQRPRMCRDLEPDPSYSCFSGWTRIEAALAWYPHQNIVAAAVEKIRLTLGRAAEE